jgi:hypothetical protein
VVDGGDVGPQTIFDYQQDGDLVQASYSGGSVRLGFLVGTRSDDELQFRYAQLRADGTTASGHCRTRIEQLPGGRLCLLEAWEWDSQAGASTSRVEEIR